MDDESQYHHDNLRAHLDGRSGVWRNAVDVHDLAYFLNRKSMTWGIYREYMGILIWYNLYIYIYTYIL